MDPDDVENDLYETRERLADLESFVTKPWPTIPKVIELVLTPERGGGYSAFVPQLPGVASQGETLRQAVASVAQALGDVLDCYEDGEVPWAWKGPRNFGAPTEGGDG